MYGRATLTQVRDYFGMNGAQMRQEWTALTQEEKDFFLNGVGEVLQVPAK